MTHIEEITITSEHTGMRADKAISQLMPDLSRARLQELMIQGKVKAQNGDIISAKSKLIEGICIHIQIDAAQEAKPLAQNIPLDILFEDEHLIVINKPCSLTVHPGAGQHDSTLVNALLFHCKDSLSGIGGVMRPGIVHRLDKDTSGVMVVAKHDGVHQHLSEQFADHGKTGVLKRRYEALVWGAPRKLNASVETYIGRHPQQRLKMAVLPANRGRRAVTHFQVIASLWSQETPKERLISHIACELETGRTHQIRVHMEYLKAPVLGDPLYGRGFLERAKKLPAEIEHDVRALNTQMLHASYLRFLHPVHDEIMTFTAPPPEIMFSLGQKMGFW